MAESTSTTSKTDKTVKTDDHTSKIVITEDENETNPFGFEVMNGDEVVVSSRGRFGSKEQAEKVALRQFPDHEVA